MENLNNHKFIKIIIVIVTIVMISVTTVFLLIKLNPKTKVTVNKPTGKVLTDTEVIEKIKINKLSDKDYRKEPKVSALLQYKSTSENLGVNILLKTSTIYSTKDSKNSNDTAEVQSQVNSLMKNNGLNTVNITLYNNNKTMQYKTYENDKIVCQLQSNDESSNHFHQISCVSKKVISDQYSAIKKLLLSADSPKLSDDYMLATVISNSKDNIKYSILNLNSKNKHQSLLFATTDEVWEYLGDLLGGGKQYATEKYSITPELQAKINDAKYKGFLKESLAKG